MDKASDFKPFPLFKGACRLPTFFGIPRTVFILLGCASGSMFLIFKFYVLPFVFIAFMICWIVTRYDDRAFRILGLWFKTKFQNTRNKRFADLWKASSYSPVRYKQKDIL